MSGKGIGRIANRRRRHGQHGLRRLHEGDRQRRAAYNLLRGRLTPHVQAAAARGAEVRRRRAEKRLPAGLTLAADGTISGPPTGSSR